MKLILKTAALATAFALAACGGGSDNSSNTSNGTDTQLNELGNAADTLEGVADNATGNVAEAVGNQAEAVTNAAETLESNAGANAAH
ncbi:MAG TPA: circumsporozoite protein [Allosphingosinicella sp.]|jgi:hypothetical protein